MRMRLELFEKAEAEKREIANRGGMKGSENEGIAGIIGVAWRSPI